VQTFIVPCSLFSFLKVSALRLASNSPLAILLQQFFSLPKASHIKKPKSKKSFKQKPPKQKPQSNSCASSFSESFIFSGKQGGAGVLREGHDIVTGETCIPASLNINNLEEAAILHFPLLGQGYANLNLQINILGKAVELHPT
jgi:hypothetical protein